MPERVEFPAQMTDVDTLAAAVRLAAIGEQRDPERAIPGNHGLLFRDGLAPMLAPNTVKSYGEHPPLPACDAVTRDTRVTLSLICEASEGAGEHKPTRINANRINANRTDANRT